MRKDQDQIHQHMQSALWPGFVRLIPHRSVAKQRPAAPAAGSVCPKAVFAALKARGALPSAWDASAATPAPTCTAASWSEELNAHQLARRTRGPYMQRAAHRADICTSYDRVSIVEPEVS